MLYLTGEIYHKGLYGETVDLEVAYKFYQEAAELDVRRRRKFLVRDIFILPCMANKYKWNDWEKFLDELKSICP